MIEQPAAKLPTTRKRIPWRGVALVLAALAVVAVVAAIAGYVWLRSYAPLRLAGAGGLGPTSLDVEFAPADSETGRTAYSVSGERGGRFGLVFDVENNGRLPITIEGLGGDEGGGDSLFPRLKLHIAGGLGVNSYDDFSPTRLGRGQRVFLGLEIITTRPCESVLPGGSITWDSVTLRYSYARFFEREEAIQLPATMSLAC